MEQKEINSQSMLRVGTILRGIYRIDSYLSSGGFGNTYVATNIESDKRVAIKEFFMKGITQRDGDQTTVSVSNSENIDCFQQQKNKFKKEAHRLRKLNNEHIVKVYDLFEDNGTAYYVMDYVDGEDLAERLKRTNSPLPEQEVYQLLPQILDGLKAIHAEGLCHLDIKPSNIMVDKGGNVILIDFGASKQIGNNGLTTSNGSTAFSQTPGYAPREQIEQNLDKIGPWTDIYALGATLYALLSNRRPPLPSDIDDDVSVDKHIALPFPENVGDLRFLVLQMMKTNRLQRPQNVDAIEIKQAPASDSHKVKNGNWVEAPWRTDEKDEKTIIGEKTETDNIKTPNTNSPKEAPDLKTKRKKDKKIIWILSLFLVVVFVLFYLNNCVSVQDMEYETSIGTCSYTGSVDILRRPHGKGEATFNDGSFYEGNFEHGVMTGKDAYFIYDNGDVFVGEFLNNSFHYGAYTIAKDKSYFIGYYSNGQPDFGTWYNKNGNVIEEIKSTNDEE